LVKFPSNKLTGIPHFDNELASVVRLDGAWFLTLAGRLGKEKAWEMDVEAWKQFS